MRYVRLLADFVYIARSTALACRYRSAAGHFQIRNPRQVGCESVLRAIAEKRIVRVDTQIFEWKHRNAFGRGGAK